MNRAFYIVGIVFSVFYSGTLSNYIEDAEFARGDYLYDLILNIDTAAFGGNVADITFNASLWSLFYILCFIAIDIFGVVKVKTKTMKVMGIIGLSLSGIFFFWNLLVMASPGAMSIDEVGPGFSFYATTMLAFTIVGLVQSTRFFKNQSKYLGSAHVDTSNTETGDLLDS